MANRLRIIKKIDDNYLLSVATTANLLSAEKRAKKGKTMRKEVNQYEHALLDNLQYLIRHIRAGTYRPSDYREFTVYEPKERTIHALPFWDRVVHQWYVYEFIIPYFVPRFVSDSYACLNDRGTHRAMRKAQKYLRQALAENPEAYYMKLDIAGFFYSIDKDTLYEIMCKHFKTPKLRELTKTLIYENFNNNTGIPIGNYTSQYFANIYMNSLDQIIKRKFKIKRYVRYMDDFILFVESKEQAEYYYDLIEFYLHWGLKLKLNKKSHYKKAKNGFDFVGYRIHKNYVLLRRNAKKTARAIAREYTKTGDYKHFLTRAGSWRGHASHADTHRLYEKVLAPLVDDAQAKLDAENKIKDDYKRKKRQNWKDKGILE